MLILDESQDWATQLDVPLVPARDGDLPVETGLRRVGAYLGNRALVDGESLRSALRPFANNDYLPEAIGIAASAHGLKAEVYSDGDSVLGEYGVGLWQRQAGNLEGAQLLRDEMLKEANDLPIQFFQGDLSINEIRDRIDQGKVGITIFDWLVFEEEHRRQKLDPSLTNIADRLGLHREFGGKNVLPVALPVTGHGLGAMLLHSIENPFLPVSDDIFDRARLRPGIDRCSVFIFRNNPGLNAEIVDDPAMAQDKEFRFPGCYKETVLVKPAPRPEDFEPVTREEVMAAFDELRPAINDVYLCNFRRFINASVQALALEDSTGEKVKQLEETLLELHVRLKELENGEGKTRERIEHILRLTDEQTQDGDVVANLSPSVAEKLLPTLSVSSRADVDSTALTRTSGLSQLGSVLDRALSAAINAYSFTAIANYGDPRINRSEKFRSERDRLDEYLQAATDLLESSISDQDLAQRELSRQSKSFRCLNFYSCMSELERKSSKISDRLREIERLFPSFPPKILLGAAPGDLWELDRPRDAGKPTAADDDALAQNSFMRITGAGIKFSMMHYDEGWGSTQASNSYDLRQSIRVAERGGEPFDYYELTNLINLFPVPQQTEWLEAIEGIEGEEFDQYVSERNNWFGPAKRPTKGWLKPESTTSSSSFEELLADVSGVLNGEKTELAEGSADRLGELRQLFGSSLMMNCQGDDFLWRFVIDSAKSGVPLSDFVMESYGDMTAAKYISELVRCEGLLAPMLLFLEVEEGGLRLTPNGVKYLQELVNPKCPYHVKGDDSVDLREMSEINRTYRLEGDLRRIAEERQRFEVTD